jgi:hypothetical protein
MIEETIVTAGLDEERQVRREAGGAAMTSLVVRAIPPAKPRAVRIRSSCLASSKSR